MAGDRGTPPSVNGRAMRRYLVVAYRTLVEKQYRSRPLTHLVGDEVVAG